MREGLAAVGSSDVVLSRTHSWSGTTTSPFGPLTRTDLARRRDGSSGRDGFGCGGKGRIWTVVEVGRSSGALPT